MSTWPYQRPVGRSSARYAVEGDAALSPHPRAVGVAEEPRALDQVLVVGVDAAADVARAARPTRRSRRRSPRRRGRSASGASRARPARAWPCRRRRPCRSACESVPNSSRSVPISAGLVRAPLVLPVFRLTYMYGMPVGESKAGSSRVPRSSARRSRPASPVIWYAESRPPRRRIVTSKFLTREVPVEGELRQDRGASRARPRPSSPTSSSVSSASTGVIRSDSRVPVVAGAADAA